MTDEDRRLGIPRRRYPVAVSVDALALAWARQEDVAEGATVTAGQELSARGRRGPVWVSQPGRSLAAAVVVRPTIPVEAEGLLWLLASVAAADGVSKATGLDVKVEWPNEILINNAVVGIVKMTAQLGPGRIDFAVLSLRLNTAMRSQDLPETLRLPTVTSLAMLGVECDEEQLLQSFLHSLEEHYEGSTASLLSAYSARCATLGTHVQAKLLRRGRIEGVAAAVDVFGRLLVTTPKGEGSIGVDILERLHRT